MRTAHSHSTVLKELIDAGVRSPTIVCDKQHWPVELPDSQEKNKVISVSKKGKKEDPGNHISQSHLSVWKDPCIGSCGIYFQAYEGWEGNWKQPTIRLLWSFWVVISTYPYIPSSFAYSIAHVSSQNEMKNHEKQFLYEGGYGWKHTCCSEHQIWGLLFFSYLKVTGFSYLRHNVGCQKGIDQPFIVVQSHFIDVSGSPIWEDTGPGDWKTIVRHLEAFQHFHILLNLVVAVTSYISSCIIADSQGSVGIFVPNAKSFPICSPSSLNL